ncbi:phage distal tail protein, Rcc01695 family [Rickettsia akari]
MTKSGLEARHLDYNYGCQKYLINNAKLSSTKFEQCNSYFKARRGSNFAFRFRDYAYYKVTNGMIARGDGNLNKFQLKKIYSDAIAPYERVITTQVKNNSVVLYINNARTMGIVDYNGGNVTLPKPLGQDTTLNADFTSDVAVRFSIDSFAYYHCNDGSIELPNIEFMAVIILVLPLKK